MDDKIQYSGYHWRCDSGGEYMQFHDNCSALVHRLNGDFTSVY